ncbi:TPA: hypothetical protein DCZ39_05340 [Patescibacteria group bacterium]|nr:hypothetical protein [Candidatus Gracilibacteria bacterium]
MILRNLNKYEEALKEFNTILEINKNYSAAYINKGIVFELLNKYEEALQAYNDAILINKDEILAHYLK